MFSQKIVKRSNFESNYTQLLHPDLTVIYSKEYISRISRIYFNLGNFKFPKWYFSSWNPVASNIIQLLSDFEFHSKIVEKKAKMKDILKLLQVGASNQVKSRKEIYSVLFSVILEFCEYAYILNIIIEGGYFYSNYLREVVGASFYGSLRDYINSQTRFIATRRHTSFHRILRRLINNDKISYKVIDKL